MSRKHPLGVFYLFIRSSFTLPGVIYIFIRFFHAWYLLNLICEQIRNKNKFFCVLISGFFLIEVFEDPNSPTQLIFSMQPMMSNLLTTEMRVNKVKLI